MQDQSGCDNITSLNKRAEMLYARQNDSSKGGNNYG